VARNCDVGITGLTELSARIDTSPGSVTWAFFVLAVCGHQYALPPRTRLPTSKLAI